MVSHVGPFDHLWWQATLLVVAMWQAPSKLLCKMSCWACLCMRYTPKAAAGLIPNYGLMIHIVPYCPLAPLIARRRHSAPKLGFIFASLGRPNLIHEDSLSQRPLDVDPPPPPLKCPGAASPCLGPNRRVRPEACPPPPNAGHCTLDRGVSTTAGAGQHWARPKAQTSLHRPFPCKPEIIPLGPLCRVPLAAVVPPAAAAPLPSLHPPGDEHSLCTTDQTPLG